MALADLRVRPLRGEFVTSGVDARDRHDADRAIDDVVKNGGGGDGSNQSDRSATRSVYGWRQIARLTRVAKPAMPEQAR